MELGQNGELRLRIEDWERPFSIMDLSSCIPHDNSDSYCWGTCMRKVSEQKRYEWQHCFRFDCFSSSYTVPWGSSLVNKWGMGPKIISHPVVLAHWENVAGWGEKGGKEQKMMVDLSDYFCAVSSYLFPCVLQFNLICLSLTSATHLYSVLQWLS